MKDYLNPSCQILFCCCAGFVLWAGSTILAYFIFYKPDIENSINKQKIIFLESMAKYITITFFGTIIFLILVAYWFWTFINYLIGFFANKLNYKA